MKVSLLELITREFRGHRTGAPVHQNPDAPVHQKIGREEIKSHRPQVCSFFYTKNNGKIRKNAFLHSNLNRLEVFHFSELEQTVSIFVFSIKFCTPNFCKALFPNSKILTIFRIKKVAHVQKTFFECPAGNASRYW